MSARCLACDSDELLDCLDLGVQPLANNFTDEKDDCELKWPLATVLCKKCFHLQLNYFIDPDMMFKHYIYVSGTSQTYKKYLKWFAGFASKPGDKVLDIGCNDGTQLDQFKTLGADTWGVDPAENLFPLSSKNHKVHLGYFDDDYNPGVLFDVINAQNVFAHNRNPYNFILNCKKIMHSNTRLYIQTSQADMVVNGEFDTIYHEHINFFNVNSFKTLVERAGMTLTDVMKTPIHGTSYMFVVTQNTPPTSNVENLINEERTMGLYTMDKYAKWVERVVNFKTKIREVLKNKFIVAYGAAAKGNTLLNFIEVTPEFIVDDNPMKQNKYSPGRKSQIVSKDFLKTLDDAPVTFLPLAWNLFDEIKSNILQTRSNPNDEFINIQDYL